MHEVFHVSLGPLKTHTQMKMHGDTLKKNHSMGKEEWGLNVTKCLLTVSLADKPWRPTPPPQPTIDNINFIIFIYLFLHSSNKVVTLFELETWDPEVALWVLSELTRLLRELVQKAWSPHPGCRLAGVRVRVLAPGTAQPSSHSYSGLLLLCVQQLLLLTCPKWCVSSGRWLSPGPQCGFQWESGVFLSAGWGDITFSSYTSQNSCLYPTHLHFPWTMWLRMKIITFKGASPRSHQEVRQCARIPGEIWGHGISFPAVI